MMKSIHIKNYKNLKDLRIDSLSRVNLIIGNNNTGKSTFLEAVSIYATGGSINNILDILNERGEWSNMSRVEEDMDVRSHLEINAFTSLYHNNDDEAFFKEPISITSDLRTDLFTEESTVEIKLGKYIIDREQGRYAPIVVEYNSTESYEGIGLSIKSLYENDFLPLPLAGRTARLTSRSNKGVNCEYVKTLQTGSNPKLFDKITLTPLEKKLIEALNIIEPRIAAINFIENESKSYRLLENRSPYVVYKNHEKKLRLKSMGDGINRMLSIVLSLLNSQNGILLIDEFENGLHYSVQIRLWEMIFMLSEQLNIQVFVTTHSNDCIKSFVNASKRSDKKLIRLENIDNEIKVVPFDNTQRLEFAIENDIEIR